MESTYQLSRFGFLRVSGIDAIKFMQGYTTCDLDTLTNAEVRMGAICNLQGRMLTSFLVIREGQDLIFRMEAALIDASISFLGKYIVFSKAELQDMSDKLVCYGRVEPADNGTCTREDSEQGPCYLIGLGNRVEQWLPAAMDVEAILPGDNWVDAELEMDVVWVTPASSEKYLPQMLNYHNLGAVDFEKGCYLGQEIVARAQYRGELKRRLHRVDEHLESVDEGELVASGSNSSRLVLNNAGDSTVEISAGGRKTSAVPVT